MSNNSETRKALRKADLQTLMLRADFKRFIFTVLDGAGMFSGNFHSEDGASFMEGRRSLGLAILGDVSDVVGTRELALSQILAAEIDTQAKENGSGRRSKQRSDDRNLDDGNVDGNGDEQPVDRAVDGATGFVQY